MATDRVAAVERALDDALARLPAVTDPLEPDTEIAPGLAGADALALWVDGVTSRAVDVAARLLKASGLGHYTISSAGHERTAFVGAATRPTDPALLHYRDGGLVAARHRIGGSGAAFVPATLRSVVADRRDPASGGRHKVWGSAPLWVIPQTSTIGSHVPKAVGLALAVDRARRIDATLPVPTDSIVVASIGDASCNHASALAGMNAAAYARRRGVGVPLLLVVEDNGLGISTPTPSRWIRAWGKAWPHVRYLAVPDDLVGAWTTVHEAVRQVREDRAPLVLHLPTVRLWGHAGSDVEVAYRTRDAIRADEARDPMLAMARELVALRVAGGPTLRDLLTAVRDGVTAARLAVEPVEPLTDRAAVLKSLVEHDDRAVTAAARSLVPEEQQRRSAFGGTTPEEVELPARRTLAAWTNATLTEVMASENRSILVGQDVGRKGGVYGVTAGLQARFGQHRVVDALLDETSILGAAQGAALAGQLPIVEVQYLAYLHNAIDQLRGEAASTSFFSDGRFRVPLVVRTASFADPGGFGGHFHNDNAVGALREIPGLAIAVPSRGDLAVALLRTAVAMARTHGRVVTVLEPTALYHRRDLHDDGDGAWTTPWPGADALALPGEVTIAGPDAARVLIVTAGNGVPACLRVARRLAARDLDVQVLDLRWLAPLPHEAVLAAARRVGRVLVVDECRASGGWADTIVSGLVLRGFTGRIGTVVAADSFVPIGPAAPTVLIGEDEVEGAVLDLADG